MKVFFELECMSTCCWGLPKPKYEPFITHNRGTLSQGFTACLSVTLYTSKHWIFNGLIGFFFSLVRFSFFYSFNFLNA